MLAKTLLMFQTVRYLKFCQIYYRIYYKLVKRQPSQETSHFQLSGRLKTRIPFK